MGTDHLGRLRVYRKIILYGPICICWDCVDWFLLAEAGTSRNSIFKHPVASHIKQSMYIKVRQ
jgi:hypothetical protein